MAIIKKSSGTGGKWLDKKILATGDKLKLTTEADWVPSQQGGEQLVAKCKVQGKTTEDMNVAINAPSKNALVDAFGEDSANWRNQTLTVEVFNTLIAGKKGVALYLIPEGFELKENSEGYMNIVNVSGEIKEDTVEYPEDDINPEDIPF